jgi:hypothetical protein
MATLPLKGEYRPVFTSPVLYGFAVAVDAPRVEVPLPVPIAVQAGVDP